MKKSLFRITVSCSVIFLFFFHGNGFAQIEDRYFDSKEVDEEKVVLPVFYSHPGSWKTLSELDKRLEAIDFNKMDVVYVYHEKGIFNYREAMEFAAENKLEWLKFHQVRAPLDRGTLFRNKALHAEFERIFDKADGVVFFGGYDIPAYVYGEKTSLLSDIVYPYRHFIEIAAVFYLLGGTQDKEYECFLESHPGFPVLGICLGFQTMNVGAGGSMIQDIWADVYGKMFLEDVLEIPEENLHRNPYAALHPEGDYSPFTIHPIKLEADGKFCREMGFNKKDRPLVLSAHHQALGKIGGGFRIIASSSDGKIIEAIEHKRFPGVLGIQFHPDVPFLWDPGARIQIFPGGSKESLVSLLRTRSPSHAFNRKIWSWFDGRLKAYNNGRGTK